MRLWHKDLIKVLPKEQLVAQWRELSSIAGAIIKNGTPNHVLVNYVIEYDYNEFISYAYYVREEMSNRGYRITNAVWDKIASLKPNYTLMPLSEIYSQIHNERYLVQCYCNLQEKYDRGGITEENWNKIENYIKGVVFNERI